MTEPELSPPPPLESREGHAEVPGGRVWYEVVGSGDGTPFLFHHGGPGWPTTDYPTLTRSRELTLARKGVFYDQLGCGKSRLLDQDEVDYSGLWITERFVEENLALRERLRLQDPLRAEGLHLIGHSWGAPLVVLSALKRPEGVKSIILSSPVLSATGMVEDVEKMYSEIGPDTQKLAIEYENTKNPELKEEYDRITNAFYERFLFGQPLDQFPEWIQNSLQESADTYGEDVQLAMLGISQAQRTGHLKTLELVPRLKELTEMGIPVLFLCGRRDEARPERVEAQHKATPGSEFHIFEKSAHMPHLTQTGEYIAKVADFMQRADLKAA